MEYKNNECFFKKNNILENCSVGINIVYGTTQRPQLDPKAYRIITDILLRFVFSYFTKNINANLWVRVKET